MKRTRREFWIALGVACLAVSVLAKDPERWDRVSGGLYRPFFHPAAVDGVYDPGAEVELKFSCSVTNDLKGSIRASVDLKEFRGETFSNFVCGTLAAAERTSATFTFRAPRRFGHYAAVMRLEGEWGPLGSVQTAFVVAPPPSDRRDPYFVIDKNCWEPDLIEAMRRFGFGGWYAEVTSVRDALSMTDEERERFYRSLHPTNRTGRVGVRGYEVSGCFRPAVIESNKGIFERANERLTRGLCPLTDEEFARIREHARRTAAELRDLISDWVLNEEFDAFTSISRDGIRDNALAWSLLSAQIQKNICLGLKDGNPGCRVAVLGPCCSDYYWEKDRFGMTKRLLSTLKGNFDYLAIDAYSGNWNGFAARLTPPEESLAALLRAGAAASEACGGPRKVVNAERCAAVDYLSAFDGALARDQADNTARSMIVNRTVEECTRYTLHVLALRWGAVEMRDNLRPYGPKLDLGIWLVLAPRGGRLTYVPRPAVATCGVVARKLAFARNPAFLQMKGGVYAATFDVGEDKSVAAVWTSEADVTARIDVPENAVMTDFGGNDAPFGAGTREMLVATTPVYLTVPRRMRTALEKSLRSLTVVGRRQDARQRHVAVGGEMPQRPDLVLAAPDAVYPPMAVMPEYGFFGRDLRYADKVAPWPRAEVRFAWNAEGLSAEVKVTDKPYVAGVDTVRLRLLASDGLASYGNESYARHEIDVYAKNVSGDASGSVWRVTVPWPSLKGMKAEVGAHVACNVVCECVPLGGTDKVRYSLACDEPNRNHDRFREHCVFLELK